MQVFIFEYASPCNYVESRVGECLTCEQFDVNNTFGILSSLFRLISEKEDFKVVFEEDEE